MKCDIKIELIALLDPLNRLASSPHTTQPNVCATIWPHLARTSTHRLTPLTLAPYLASSRIWVTTRLSSLWSLASSASTWLPASMCAIWTRRTWSNGAPLLYLTICPPITTSTAFRFDCAHFYFKYSCDVCEFGQRYQQSQPKTSINWCFCWFWKMKRKTTKLNPINCEYNIIVAKIMLLAINRFNFAIPHKKSVK